MPYLMRRACQATVSVEVLLQGFAQAHPVAEVVGGDVAVDARAQANAETAHLAQVYCVALREESRIPGAGHAAHVHAGDVVAPAALGGQDLDGVQLALAVQKLACSSRWSFQCPGGCRPRFPKGWPWPTEPGHRLRHQRVGGPWRQEGELGGDEARAGRAAEEAAELVHQQAVHGRHQPPETGTQLVPGAIL